MHIHTPHVPSKCIAYICDLMDRIVSGTSMAIICEVGVVLGCVLVHVWTIVGSICQYRNEDSVKMAAMWQLYSMMIANNLECVYQITCTVLLVSWLMLVTSYVWHIDAYTSPTYVPER